LEILSFQLTPFITNCYVLRDGGEAIVIDPGEVTPALLEAIEGRKVPLIVNTHCHCDHCGGNAELKKITNAELVCHRDELPLLRALVMQGQMFGVPYGPSPDPDRFIDEGDTVSVGGVTMKVVNVPGHSPGHVALIGDGFVIGGDVLFSGSIGRTDLLGGNYDQLMESIRTKLLTLPDDFIVYSGHGPATTIGEERESNPFLTGL
jgi:hydroxyacylglutathione hydrolase